MGAGATRDLLAGLGLALLGAVLLFARLDIVSVWDGDEPKAPVVARTMVETGDWLRPRWNGRLRLEKPPLYPWLVALGLPDDGALNEARARWPAAAAAAIGVGATVALGRRLAGPAAGWIAGLVLLTSPIWVVYARRALADSTLAALCAVATLGFAWALPPGGRRWAGLLGFVAVGLGWLAKGPVALLPLVGVVVLAAVRWDGEVLRAMPWGWGSLLAGAIALPWFVVIAHQHLPELLEVARFEILERAASGAGVHPRPALWYLLVLPINFFPWSLFLPAVVRELPRRSGPGAGAETERGGSPGLGLAAASVASGLIVFAMVSGKRDHYLLPVYPTLAVLVGAWWAGRLVRARAAPDPLAGWGHPAALVTGTLGLAVPLLVVGLALLVGERLGAAAGLAGLTSLAGGWLLVRERGASAAGRLAGAGLVGAAACAALVFWAGPAVDRYRSSVPLAAGLAPYVDGRPLLVAGPMGPPTALLFYDRRLPVIELIPLEQVPEAVASGRGLALVPVEQAVALSAAAPGSLVVLRTMAHRSRRLALMGPAPATTPRGLTGSGRVP